MKVIEKNGELEFKYTLVDGIADYSFAIYSAESIGIPKSVVCRSMEVGETFQINFSILVIFEFMFFKVYKSLMDNKPDNFLSEDEEESEFFNKLQPLFNSFLTWDFNKEYDGNFVFADKTIIF